MIQSGHAKSACDVAGPRRPTSRPTWPGDGERGLTEELIGQLGYFGIALILVLGGLGLPVPEEAPIILAAMLSRTGKMRGNLR